jgi:transcriptional regulator with XRE-family HTH domain
MVESVRRREPADTDLRIGAEARTSRPGADIDPGIAAGPDISWLSGLDAEPASPKPAQASSLGAGHLILVARELTGLSQRKLAGKAGTSQPALARLETGNGLPSIRTLLRIADVAGFELVIGLRRPKSTAPDPEALQRWGLALLGVLQPNPEDGLADFVVLREPSPLEGGRCPISPTCGRGPTLRPQRR